MNAYKYQKDRWKEDGASLLALAGQGAMGGGSSSTKTFKIHLDTFLCPLILVNLLYQSGSTR